MLISLFLVFRLIFRLFRAVD